MRFQSLRQHLQYVFTAAMAFGHHSTCTHSPCGINTEILSTFQFPGGPRLKLQPRSANLKITIGLPRPRPRQQDET